ncbi:MAG: flagellar hook-length control protein FliK [Janthinobacterium lividum]
MAIELGNSASMLAATGAARAAGRAGASPTAADGGKGGDGSFASALSASNAAAPADTASAKQRGADWKAPARGPGAGDGGAEVRRSDASGDARTADEVDDTDETDETDETDAVATDSSAPTAGGAPPLPVLSNARTSSPPGGAVGDAPPFSAQPDLSGSALLLAQSTLGSAAHGSTVVPKTVPPVQGVQSVAAGPAVRAGDASDVQGAGGTEAYAAVAAAVAVGTAAVAATTSATVAVAGAVMPDSDVVAQVAGAVRDPALRAAPASAPDTAASASASPPSAPAIANGTAQAALADGVPPVSAIATAAATAAVSSSASSAAAQQAQRAIAQAVAERAAQQAPAGNVATAAVAAAGRATDSLGAAALAGAAAGESSPLLRRFERVLSMAHAAGGDASAPGGGNAFAASAFTTPVDAAGAVAGAGGAPGAADRSADAMNGWLAQVVAQKNQNASLTVEVGGRPVSVDVQVKGNEAQVVFRADQAETRTLLAQAMPQLRQMMGAEGMVLSDASVAGQWGAGGAQSGSGGAGGSGGSSDADTASGQRMSPARRDAATPAVGATGGPARSGGARSLDLYV